MDIQRPQIFKSDLFFAMDIILGVEIQVRIKQRLEILCILRRYLSLLSWNGDINNSIRFECQP